MNLHEANETADHIERKKKSVEKLKKVVYSDDKKKDMDLRLK